MIHGPMESPWASTGCVHALGDTRAGRWGRRRRVSHRPANRWRVSLTEAFPDGPHPSGVLDMMATTLAQDTIVTIAWMMGVPQCQLGVLQCRWEGCHSKQQL